MLYPAELRKHFFIIYKPIDLNNLSKFFFKINFSKIFIFYSLSKRNHIKLEKATHFILTKRLTEKQKEEILKSFKSGMDIDFLSQKYTCTNSTIIRNLKKNLGEIEFKELAKKSKSSKRKPKSNNNQPVNAQKINLNNNISKNLKVLNENKSPSNFDPTDSFFEIPPLDFVIDNSSRKELSSVSITEVDFPKVVYMIVDKKIELETKFLKDFPEWEFLPHADLNRKTIEIFYDLNLAKRSCNKDQKVLKVPNTDVFRIAAPHLVSKGISRIVCPENLISL